MKDQIELPPLPEACIVSYQTDSTMRRMELRTYSDEDMKDYARAAVEADRKRRGEPVAWKEHAAKWLRRKAAEQQATNEQYPEHAKHYPTWETWVLKLNWLANELSEPLAPQPAEPVKRKRRYAQGTALGEFGIIPMCDQVDDKPVNAPPATAYCQHPHCQTTGGCQGPCSKKQAEPVKMPSDDLAHEIWAAAQTAPGEGIEDAVERVAALLARYGKGTP